MDKALLNFLAIVIFIGIILYVLPMANVDVGAGINDLTLQSISLLPTGLPLEPIPTPRPIPTLLNITMRPSITPTPAPTVSATPVPSPSPTPVSSGTPVPCPTPSPILVPTTSPASTPEPPAVLPTAVTTITPLPGMTATITPMPANMTPGPVIGNATATPAATGGNVTEQVGTPGRLTIVAIVILALLIVGAIAWNRWKGMK